MSFKVLLARADAIVHGDSALRPGRQRVKKGRAETRCYRLWRAWAQWRML
jgi:hypothetical protein